MKIFSFLEHHKAKRLRFKYDLYRVMVSLRARRYNWKYHYDFHLKNEAESMYVWVANKEFGLHFTVEGRRYGDVTGWSVAFGRLTWRRKLLRVALEAGDSKEVEKWGYMWDQRGSTP